MFNVSEAAAMLENLASGKGAYYGVPVFVQAVGDGVSMAAGKLYSDGTDVYVFGSGSLAKI